MRAKYYQLIWKLRRLLFGKIYISFSDMSILCAQLLSSHAFEALSQLAIFAVRLQAKNVE